MEKLGLMYEQVTYFLSSLWDVVYGKLVLLSTFIFTIYLVPTYEMMIVISFFMLSNLGTGIHKTLKFNGAKSVSFQRITDSLVKLILYVFGLIVMYVLQHHIGKDLINFVYIYASGVSIREAKSIIENIETITDTKIWYLIKSHVNEIYKNLKVKINKNE